MVAQTLSYLSFGIMPVRGDWLRPLIFAANEGAIQESSGSNVWSVLLVAILFGAALYAICRSSRRQI